MARKTEGVRIGPISLLTLISVLLLAVLAMLCVTTSNAARAMSERQAAAATDSYAIESCGQTVLARIDEIARGNGTDAASAVAAIDARLDSVKSDATDGDASKNLQVEASTDGDTVSFKITSEDGRELDASITYADDLTYSVNEWKVTTAQTDDSSAEGLWSPSSSN